MIFNVRVLVTLAGIITIIRAPLVPMKVVEEPASYSFQNELVAPVYHDSNNVVSRVSPAQFSGPLHFKQLLGKCFSLRTDDYKYVLCPFHNVTQYEMSIRWGAYQGVLGVWTEWKIINNSFTSMMMEDGDACGNIFRSVEVELLCNETDNTLVSVSEPNKCQYLMSFATPLACHADSFLVYPRLSSRLREHWDHIEMEYSVGYLTRKGYNNDLKKIFIEAGFMKNRDKFVSKNSSTTNPSTAQVHSDDLIVLQECQKEVQELINENNALKLLLRNNHIDFGEANFLHARFNETNSS